MAQDNVRIPVSLEDSGGDAFGWCQLTDANATNATFVVEGGSPVYIRGTTGATAPADAGGVIYYHGYGERNVALADMFPGVASVRLWARCEGPAASSVRISHD